MDRIAVNSMLGDLSKLDDIQEVYNHCTLLVTNQYGAVLLIVTCPGTLVFSDLGLCECRCVCACACVHACV